jgi:hypothetical protein
VCHIRVALCLARRRHTSNNVLVCTFTTKPFLEVAGIELAHPRTQKSTSALCTRSEQARHSARGLL